MKTAPITAPLAAFCLAFSLHSAQAQQIQPKASTEDVAKAVKSLVEREFYKPVTFPALTGRVTDADIDRALAAFGTSHTARYRPGSIEYFEIADILRYPIRRDLERQFPRGEPVYAGIGLVSRVIEGRRFVSDIYDGTPAAKAGIKVGDELLGVDGKPYDEVASFADRISQQVTLSLRRKDNAPPIDVPVKVERIRPTVTFARAIDESMRVIEQGGLKIAYVRLWALGSGGIESSITHALKTGSLKDTDGLVIDLRGRWGGRFDEVPEMLTAKQEDVTFTGRDGKTSYVSARYDKPVVAIIDEGTRSAQEMFAELLRRNGATLVGKRTAGAVLATRAYMLPDESLLVVPISEVRIGGELLEGKGVAPDKEVSIWLPYADGADPQHGTAIDSMVEKLCANDTHAKAAACSASETGN